MLQGCLGEEDVVIGDALQHEERVMPVVPAIAEVDGEKDVVAECLAPLPDAADQLEIRDEIVEEHLHLHGTESCLERHVELPEDLRHQVVDAAALGQAGINRAVRPQLRSPRAAHELVGRQAQLLAGQIVKRNVDGGDGMHAEAAAAWPEGSLIELLPEARDLDRILADKDLARIAAPQMGRRHVDEALDHGRRRIGLAKAHPTILVVNLDDDRVGRAVEIIGRPRRRNHRDRFDPCNPAHHCEPSLV